jgi:hypothetical protein
MLSNPVAEPVLTCDSAESIWYKPCAWLEGNSMRRLNIMFELFFQTQPDCKEDFTTHVAKLQELLVDLNN